MRTPGRGRGSKQPYQRTQRMMAFLAYAIALPVLLVPIFFSLGMQALPPKVQQQAMRAATRAVTAGPDGEHMAMFPKIKAVPKGTARHFVRRWAQHGVAGSDLDHMFSNHNKGKGRPHKAAITRDELQRAIQEVQSQQQGVATVQEMAKLPYISSLLQQYNLGDDIQYLVRRMKEVQPNFGKCVSMEKKHKLTDAQKAQRVLFCSCALVSWFDAIVVRSAKLAAHKLLVFIDQKTLHLELPSNMKFWGVKGDPQQRTDIVRSNEHEQASECMYELLTAALAGCCISLLNMYMYLQVAAHVLQ